MNEEQLSQIFAECTEAIEQGRLMVDDCLDKYPQYRAELIDLLQVAMQTRAVPTAVPAAEFRQGARPRLLNQLPPRAAADGTAAASDLGATTAVTRRLQTVWQTWWQRWPWPVQLSWAVVTVFLLVFLFFMGTWLWPSDGETELAQDNPPVPMETMTPPAEMGVTAPETPPAEAAPTEDSPAEIAAAPTPDDSFYTYIPAVSSPLVLNAQTAAVEVTQGLVEVQNEDGEWTAVNHLATAAAGQRVRTGAFSGATITFYDDSQATLGPNTEISLDRVNARRPEVGFRTVVMTQWAGESKHDVAFRNDSGSRYEVMTPNGSARARGTTFQVLVSVNLLTQVIVSEGRVDVTNLNVTVIVIAGQTSIVPPQQPPNEPRFTVSGRGEVTARGETWTIGGQTFATTDSTIIVGNPQIGDIVSVSGYLLPDGTLVATYIILLHRTPANQFSLTGEVTSIGPDEWVVAGQTIAVDGDTAVDETIVVGDTAHVYGLILADPSATDGSRPRSGPAVTLLAERIDKVDDTQPFEFIGVVQSIGPDNWLISGVTIAVDASTEIKDDIVVGDVVKVEGVVLADAVWLAHEIKLAEDGDKFEFTGTVNQIDLWQVAGISFAVDDFTEIDSGIDIGDLVYVEGRILAGGTWLATEIRLLSDEGLTFSFIGTVDAVDPWIISGIPITVDAGTLIDDTIEVGALVRVHGRILPDGDWLAALIVRLDEDDDPLGCYTVTTTVISVSGSQITLKGLPPLTLNEDILVEGDIAVNAIITVTICVNQDGTIIIVSIIVIHTAPPPPPPAPPPPPDDGPPPPSGGGSYDISGNNENLTLTCNGHTVTVRGNDNTITLRGSCGSIVVRGNNNTIFYQAAGSITNTGNNNSIQQR